MGFDFLGYPLQSRRARGKDGRDFVDDGPTCSRRARSTAGGSNRLEPAGPDDMDPAPLAACETVRTLLDERAPWGPGGSGYPVRDRTSYSTETSSRMARMPIRTADTCDTKRALEEPRPRTW